MKTPLERRRLAALPSLACSADRLKPRDEIDLRAMLDSSEIAADWEAVADRLTGFGIPDGTGGVNPGDRRAVYYLASYLRPARVLEVGTHIGASTIHLAAALSKVEGARLTSVDIEPVNDPVKKPWLTYGSKQSPAQMIEELGFTDFVSFESANSSDYLSAHEGQFDLVFLDGHHGATTVYQEVPAALSALKPGGVILLHDYFPGLRPLWSTGTVIHGPALAAERLQREGLRAEVLPLGALPWPTKLGSNVTSLALLLRSS